MKLMGFFPNAFVTRFMEVVLSKKGNVYFKCKEGMTREEILCAICEWVSRDVAKGEPYGNDNWNRLWRDSLALRLSAYIGKVILPADWYMIYDRLGNRINHNLTTKFVESGFDMAVLNDGGKVE